MPRSETDLLHWLSSKAKELEFESCAMGMRFPLPLTRPRIALMTSYPKAWEQRYVEQGYHMIDPTVARCVRTQLPVIWEEVLFQGAEEMWDEAQSFGLKEGWAQSRRDGLGIDSMLTFARSGTPVSRAEQQAKGLEMKALLDQAHQLMLKSIRAQLLAEMSSPLTDREVEVLRWAADGKTGQDVGQILGISLATVRFHTKNAMAKLRAPNLPSAITCALMLDLLQGSA